MAELKRLGLIDPAHLLDAVVEFIRSYVVVTTVQAHALGLWVLHTHAFEAAEVSPYLAVLSPEKRCGKTLLLRVLALLVRDPWRVISPSESVVYRKIEQDQPTLLLDEVDAIFSNRTGDYEGLRAILNAGNEPDTHVPRCGGANRSASFTTSPSSARKRWPASGSCPTPSADRPAGSGGATASGEQAERFRRREAERGRRVAGGARMAAPGRARSRGGTARSSPDELDDRARTAGSRCSRSRT